MITLKNLMRSKLNTVTAAVLLSLPLITQAALPTPVGNVFTVNTQTEGAQTTPVALSLTSGGYVVIWNNEATPASSIYAQLFNADGTRRGNEFQVNTDAVKPYTYTSMVKLGNGGFAVFYDYESGLDAKFQLFDASGSKVGTESVLRENDGTIIPIHEKSVAGLNDGGFVVSYSKEINSEKLVYARRYKADGSPDGVEFLVAAEVPVVQDLPSIARLNDGGYVVGWIGIDKDSEYGLFVKRFNADNTPAGEPVKVIEPEVVYYGQNLQMHGLADGTYLVSWIAGAGELWAQHVNANGTLSGPEFSVSGRTANLASYYRVDSSRTGGFTFAWEAMALDDIAVYAKHYGASAKVINERFNVVVGGVPGAVASMSDGDFTVFWGNVYGDNADIFAQRFGSDSLADSNAQVRLDGLPSTLYVGEEISFDVKVNASNVYGVDTVLTLDKASAIEWVSADYGSYFPESHKIEAPSLLSEGKWEGAQSLTAPASPKSGVGTFATLTFSAQEAGNVNFELASQVSDQQGVLAVDETKVYSVTIKPAVIVSGDLKALGFDESTFSQIYLFINGQLTQINADGTFEAPTRPGEVTIRIELDGFLPAEKTVQLTENGGDFELKELVLVGGNVQPANPLDPNDTIEKIDVGDLTKLLGAYRSTREGGAPYIEEADFNRDGKINIQDLSILGSNFGKSGPQSF
ncbi:hypothetical protein [Pseudoalteromonas sp. T1lg23B]|uniref:hypothetical protein n=1 Tax=Pseudoalteromonas sp. T1lg23B TaxID=2077097 RepID=UPI00131A0F39|nr:hypothetical protein [Pseudoalteromonas sp. T1lg23B]